MLQLGFKYPQRISGSMLPVQTKFNVYPRVFGVQQSNINT
jgi:hypothetical protein